MIIPEIYAYIEAQGGQFYSTKLLNHIMVLLVWCPEHLSREKTVKMQLSLYPEKKDTAQFSAQHGAEPLFHQDLRVRAL